MRDDGGHPLYAIGLVEDLTDQEEATRLIQDQQERLQMILEASGMAAWEIAIDTGEYVNSENLSSVFGTSSDGALEYEDFLSRVHPEDLDRFFASPLARGDEGVDRFVVDYRLRRDDGTCARLRSQGSFVRDASGRAVAVRGTTVDVTEQHEAEQARLEQAQVYRRMIDAARDAFVGVDRDGLIVEWNRAAEAIFGWPAGEAMGRRLVGTAISPQDRTADEIGFVDPTDDGEVVVPGRVAMTGVHRNGREFPIEASFVHLPEGGGSTRFRAFIRDITDQVAYEKQLADQALTDSLTALPNRALFVDRLREAVVRLRRNENGLAVLFLDVDRFKVVNDSLGHAVGDEVLVALAERLREHLRPGDTLARFGGDEFVVLCEDLADPTAAGELAQRLLNALEPPLLLGERRHHATVSIGIAPVGDPTADPEEIIRNADTAMYRAKERGGSQFEIFDDAIRTRALARPNLENDLRAATWRCP